MDKETQTIIDQAAEKGAKVAVAQMREFHLDEIKVMRERMDIGFESVERRFNAVDTRFDGIDQRLDKMNIRFDGIDGKLEIIDQRLDRTENALQTLLDEFKKHREEVTELKKQISDLTLRVQVLEGQLAATH